MHNFKPLGKISFTSGLIDKKYHSGKKLVLIGRWQRGAQMSLTIQYPESKTLLYHGRSTTTLTIIHINRILLRIG